MADADLYDEFGNYCGPELDSDSSDDSDDEASAAPSDHSLPEEADEDDAMDVDADRGARVGAPSSEIVLHEDKQHYPSASTVYGEGVHTAVIDEDAQALEEPIIAPTKTKNFSSTKTSVLDANQDRNLEFATPREHEMHMLDCPQLLRGVAVVGHLHAGKTALVDLLAASELVDGMLSQTSIPPDMRYTDTLAAEQEREMSTKSTPITIPGHTTLGKTYVNTFIDCPGHVNFHDESVAAMRCADGVVLCVDAVEGVMIHTEMLMSHALSESLHITVVITKIDRLILELHLPPADAYYKLQHTIDTINTYIKARNPLHKLLSPERGNVAFSSSHHGYVFTTYSFAEQYYRGKPSKAAEKLSPYDFSKRLWGDCFLDPDTRQFKKSNKSFKTKGVQRTFVQFILEPLYKLYTTCLGEAEKDAAKTLKSLGVNMTKSALRQSARPLIKETCAKFFGAGHASAVVDMLVDHVPSPTKAGARKVEKFYTGDQTTAVAEAMRNCDSKGPLMINVVKLYASSDGSSFSAFGRIYSGSVRVGDKVKVLGEAYSLDDDEDMAYGQVAGVYLPKGRSLLGTTRLGAGNWIVIDGIDASISKTATVTGVGEECSEVEIFRPLNFFTAGGESAVKIAVEPLNPAELPKMVEGLRRVCKSYPMARTKVEESGEHVLLGVGELYLDCVMHDLRHMYSEVEIKVSDPSVPFCETVVETSSVKCFAETPNQKNKLTFISEPLDEGLAMAIEKGHIDLGGDVKEVGKFFQSGFGWDVLSARSVWAFGPGERGGNILMDDTLPGEVDKQLLNTTKNSIVQGFQWAMREGPLCEEPLRNVKVKLLDVALAQQPIMRGGGQIIPTARRAIYSSILTATPRLMEPVYRMQIQCPNEITGAIFPLLSKRRGHIIKDEPKPGCTFTTLKAYIPVIDSFGFETDLRAFTQGQAMCFSVLDHWNIVPGNPLDSNIILHPLEPSPVPHLAREFLIKTRRRKGLSDNVSIYKYFDEAVKEQLMEEA
jgi:U5 small nuclear ribonucleoprotein component